MPNHYTITELAAKAGVTRDRVHYYRRNGILMPPTRKGNHVYRHVWTEGHLIRLNGILALKAEGYTLRDLKALYAQVDTDAQRNSE